MNVNINGPGHITKMATMANSKNHYTCKSYSSEPETYDFETWPEVSMNTALQSMYKS